MTSSADATELPAGLLDMIEQDEGRRDTVYIDSEGHQTIGLGFCLDRMPMPREVADFWCNLILTQRHKQILIATHFGTVFKNLNQPRQCAILNMSYQLGISGLFKFKKCGMHWQWATTKQPALRRWTAYGPARQKTGPDE